MTHNQQVAQARARSTLAHYLRTAFESAGIRWDADNESEIDSIIKDIIYAATPADNLPS
jgi:hypothetical protein